MDYCNELTDIEITVEKIKAKNQESAPSPAPDENGNFATVPGQGGTNTGHYLQKVTRDSYVSDD
jgi:hypothetical protein